MKEPTRAFARVGSKSEVPQNSVDFPGFCVSLDLAIPCRCIKLSEPLPKLCEFLSRESEDSLLEGFDFTHTETVPPSSFTALRSSRGCLRMLARVGFDYRHHF